MTASRDIRIATLKLQNDRHKLVVTVEHDKRRQGIYLRIICTDGGMYQLFGGPKGAYVLLEPRDRFNAPALARWAKAFEKGPSQHVIYADAVNSVCEANGYILATSEEDAYKPATFVRGQRVTIGKDPALIVNVGEVSKFSGRQTYDLVLDSNWYWTGREADGHGMEIKAIEGEPIMSDEAVEARFAEFKQAEAEREAEKQLSANAEQTQVDAKVRELKAKYPWAKQDGSDHARASANLKTELQNAFPGVLFSVKSDSYSGGSSIYVKWQDGPTEHQVGEISSKYQYVSHMDQTDLVHSKTGPFNTAVSIVLGQSRYVSISRSYSSDELVNEVREALVEKYPEYAKDDHDHYFGVHVVLRRSEITGEFTGLGLNENEEVIALFDKPVYVPTSPEPIQSSGEGVTVRENAEKGGVEVKFSAKPDPAVLDGLKRHGFRWSKFQKIWYAKANDRTRSYANGLIDSDPPASSGAAFTPDYFDMQVEDNMAMACGV